jgi:hypothetical protein
MAKKRAPGAGRKPRGEFQGKSAVLTTRIMPETRVALERAAAKGKRSLSQEVEHGLRWYLSTHLRRTPERGDHIRALGEAVSLVAQYIERATEQRWNEDAFTGEALRQGCTSLIAHFAPRGTPVTPRLIKETATRLPSKAAETYSDAAGVGVTEAGKVITSIESWNFRKLEDVQVSNRVIPGRPESHFPEEWYMHAQLLRELGSGWERAQGRKKQR